MILGIDPGASGGIALIDEHGAKTLADAWRMPDTPADLRDLIETLTGSRIGKLSPRISHCWLEKVHAMPKQGVASTFKFGVGYGVILGVLACERVPVTQVSPGTWQRAMGCLTGGDKNITKRRAQELYPELKVTHAIADALLIATYGWRQRNSE